MMETGKRSKSLYEKPEKFRRAIFNHCVEAVYHSFQKAVGYRSYPNWRCPAPRPYV